MKDFLKSRFENTHTMNYIKILKIGSLCLAVLMMASTLVAANDICEYVTTEAGFVIGGVLPGFIPYKNEKINIYTTTDEPVGHITTKDGALSELDCTLIEEPTYIIKVQDVQTIKDILEAESAADALDDALGDDKILVDGQTATKAVKNFFTQIFIKIGSWFS
ncbi:MAG: hypothetical protein ACI8Y7_000810 [Candidatus Woesearchaeota archaeon]|jgi:hypothetical protein